MTRRWLCLLVLALAGCSEKAAVLAPVMDAGPPAPRPEPFQARPTAAWDVDFFAVNVVALVARTRHVDVVSVGPVRDDDVLPGLDAGTIPDTTRTVFSDGSYYTVILHPSAKLPFIAVLHLAGERTIQQADENLDGHRDSVREQRADDAEVSWRSTRGDGRFDQLTTQEVVERKDYILLYRVHEWSDADGDGQWTLEKTFMMSNVSH
jgi:hypothetical protein